MQSKKAPTKKLMAVKSLAGTTRGGYTSKQRSSKKSTAENCASILYFQTLMAPTEPTSELSYVSITKDETDRAVKIVAKCKKITVLCKTTLKKMMIGT